MLEISIRIGSGLDLATLIGAITCSACSTYQEGLENLHRFPHPGSPDFVEYATQRLGQCGGLLEVVSTGSTRYTQLMHQTVQEFATSLKFKQLVLGSRAKITIDNGYTFFSKWSFLSNSPESQDIGFKRLDLGAAAAHARSAEETTGRCQKSFLDSIPPSVFVEFVPDAKSMIGFASSCGLRLYILESLKSDPLLLQNCYEPLLFLCIVNHDEWAIRENCLDSAKLLLKHGFVVAQDPLAFPALVNKLLEGRSHTEEKRLSELVMLLLESGQDPLVDIRMKWESATSGPRRTYKALHIAPIEIATWLLGRGVDPNVLDSEGLTPLDYAICCPNVMAGARSDEELYRISCLLAARRGVLRDTPSKIWKSRLDDWERQRLDVRSLRQYMKGYNAKWSNTKGSGVKELNMREPDGEGKLHETGVWKSINSLFRKRPGTPKPAS